MDLKPSNIMLHVDEMPETLPRPMLSDFGTCHIIGEGVSSEHGGYAMEFCPPERLETQEMGEKGDMWSAGLVLYAMCYGDLPYHSDDPMECRRQVMSHKVLPEPSNIAWQQRDERYWNVVCILTSRQPVARPSARECEVLAAQELARLALAPKSPMKSLGSPSMHPQMIMDSSLPQLQDGELN